jgi:hypothetical protein
MKGGNTKMSRRKIKVKDQNKTQKPLPKNYVHEDFKKSFGGFPSEVLDYSDAPDEFRVSDRISRMIKPYVDSMDLLKLVDCATIAWNACIEEDFGISGSCVLNNESDYANSLELINELKIRKRLMFKRNRKHINMVKVYDEGDIFHITVASIGPIESDLELFLDEMEALHNGDDFK